MLAMPALCWLCLMPLNLARHGACSVCLRQLMQQRPDCPRCGLTSGRTGEVCRRCLKNSPPWQHLITVTRWQPPLKQLVNRLKFYRTTALAVMLARLILLRWLAEHRRGGLRRPDLLLSVPLHSYRAWRRGYNQLDDMAQLLAHWTRCRYLPQGLVRIRAGRVQHRLGALARRRNLRGAFRVRADVRGRHVALLDDVVTTGSTVAEISRMLLAAGAASVQIWCLCRTL